MRRKLLTWGHRRGAPVKVVAAALGLVVVVAGLSTSAPRPAAGPAAPAIVPAAVASCVRDTAEGAAAAPAATRSVEGDGPDYEELVGADETQPRTVTYDGAKVLVKPGALTKPVSIGITRLTDADLSTLDSGMTNVTGKARSGFRFTPHPMRFAAAVEVTLPYDPELLPDGFAAQDLYTHFYDDVAGCWQVLERVSVDEVGHTVTSLTDHFTDMVNSTVTVPEHPENVSFNPNQLKGIQAGDPGAKVNLIAPPQADNTGDNRLSYPIEVPPGRLGLQPQLAITYSSAAADGWLGVGWDLTTPAITVDTRWGVPRYETARETETYLLNGEQLTPVANRGTPPARTAEKVFSTRVEGGFARIVRHGTGPANYTWEVVDKTGTHWFYGTAGARLADGSGNVFLWALRDVRDANGNLMRYHHTQVDDPGVAGGDEPGRNLYVQRITYTGRGDTEGRYAVTFTRDRELNEPRRVDTLIDARGRFKRVTADLLRRVDVTLDGGLIRRYELAYTTGAFHKTLLRSVAQLDANGAPFTRHEFSYYDDIRDAQGNYQAFSPAEWTVPGDGLGSGALNLTPAQAGNASALNANTSTGGGAHLYVGVGTSPSKTNSVGVKVGSSHTSDDGVLALVDVDGDALPDKVFRSGGAVRYRKNLSGPHGQPRFAVDSKPLNLPGIMGERTDSLTLGIEAYPGAVAAQLDYVNTFATTNRYFADVNGDGIADLVSGSSVLFGRVGVDGVPVYGVSADTPVPVTPGTIDTSGLFGDLSQDRERLIDSFPLLDTVRRWVAPFDGVVRVQGTVQLAAGTAADRAASRTADGVRVAIQHEDAELWSERIGRTDDTAHAPTGVDSVAVSRGDRLYFRVQSGFDGSLDEVSWDPVVSYLSVPDGLDVNGLAAYRFQASRDFTLGGRSGQVTAPLTGTLHLAGDLHKNSTTTDDITVVIARDGTPVLEQTLGGGATGTVPVNLDVTVQQGQTLTWRVRVDSPIDQAAIAWVPHAFYTAAQGVERVTDAGGNPLIDVFPPYDVDMYPADALTAPQGFFDVPADGQLTVAPQLLVDFAGETPSGRIAFTVKKRGALLAKRFFEVHAGVLTAPAPVTVDVEAGDDLFFDFSTLDRPLLPFLVGQSVQVTLGSGTPVGVPSALHSAAEEGAFPQPYRGWGATGYNGNRDRAGQPIVQGDLVVDGSFADQLPDGVDPQGQRGPFGQDPRVDPPKVVPFAASPQHDRWGTSEHSWVAGGGASSSRLGTEAINLPQPSDFAGASAVPRLARSQQLSLTGGVAGPVGSLGGSLAAGESSGQVDFLDMNGDGFPDVVSAGGIQYTDPTGGLGDMHGPMPDGAVRRSTTAAGNASAGSAARTIGTGRGHATPPGYTNGNTAEAGNDMPPLGVGGDIGGALAKAQFDLLDVNGDDLPDRVYADGRVALNLGYHFGAEEHWRNPAALNDGSSTNAGLNLGFNTDFYGFAGGVSYHEGNAGAASTLLDVNGDGLADRVLSGTPIRVGLNTGNGFEPPVEFRGSLASVGTERNARVGGGAYFTFPICFVVACAVFNPGADLSTGASRTEQALRDLNGDGFADHVSSTSDDQLVVAENRTGRTNLLRTVGRPLGGRIDFDYARDGNTYGQPQSKFVLSRVTVDDGHPGDGQDVQLTTYEYAGGVYDRLEREFDGYATVVERHRDPGAAEAVFRSLTHEYRTDGHYTRGLATRTVSTDAAGNRFVETENTYLLRDVGNPAGSADPASTTATIFPQLVRTDRRFYEGQASAGKATSTTMEYDPVGNLTRSFDAGDSGTGDDLDVRIGYSVDDPACRTAGITGTANRVDVLGGGAPMRHRESTVDCSTGDITQVRAELTTGTTAVTDLTYFANGNLHTVTGPPNSSNQRFALVYAYDPVVESHVESVTDSFGYRSSSTHDLRFGLVETSTDINNQVVRNGYDAAGRLDTVTGPYEAAENRVTIDFEYHPEATVPYAVTRHVDREADGTVRPDTIDTVTFADGLNRKIQTKSDAAVLSTVDTPSADVMVVSGHVVYDFVGRAVREHFPVTQPKGPANTTFDPAVDAVAPTERTYDVLDRVTRTVLPDATVATAGYGFGPDRSGTTRFETVSTDANGKSRRSYRDLRELTTAVKEFNPAGGQPVVWTSYGYDALGQRTSIVDDHANTTTTAYDNLGRRTRVDSPDSGRTDTGYDLAGNVVRKVTAKLAATQQAIEYDYEFNRRSAIRYPVFPANDVSYTYGGPNAPDNTANRITTMVDGAGTLTREYGPLGEVTAETRTVSTQGSHIETFTTRYRYDTWNRMLRLTYPDGEVLSYHYDSGGQVDRASGVKGPNTYQYLTRLAYDKFGQRALLDTGNGTRTRYTYGSTTQRLENLKANLAQGYEFQNIEYTYDNVGNVTAIENDTVSPGSPTVGTQVGGPSTETFQYDDLYRLTHAEGSYQPRTPQTDRYRLDLQYDSINNITGKAQVHELVSNGNTIVDGKLTYTNAYGYGGRPHAPTTIGAVTFAYDANGNQISRTQQPQPRRQLIWDEENRLACSHENVQSTTLPQTPDSCDNAGGVPEARYRYDDRGDRIVKDSAQFHVYPNQNFSTRGNQAFKHVYLGTARLLTKMVEGGDKVEDRQFFAHGDHLGSTGFVTDSAGGLAEHLRYIPGGETWVDEHPSQPVPNQFTGKELDPETGLYYFGARYYDPRTNLWQSPDPALPDEVREPKDLSAYLYASANPVRFTDPDGRQSVFDPPGGWTPQQKENFRKLYAALGNVLAGLRETRRGTTDPAKIAQLDQEIEMTAGTMDWVLSAIGPVEYVKIDGMWRAVPAGSVEYRQIDGKLQAVPARQGQTTYIQVDGKWREVPADSVQYKKIDGVWRAVPVGQTTYIQIDGEWREVPADSVTYKKIDGVWRAVPADPARMQKTDP